MALLSNFRTAPPTTSIRTSHALTIRAQGLTIGIIQTWGINMTRQVTHVYEINQSTSGEPIEAVPGNVGGLSISVNRYDLFTRRMEQAFGTPDFEMLGDQSDPFEVKETWRFPNNAIEARSYVGCWFSSLGRTYSAGGDRLVQVNANLVFVRKIKIQ
jgi:hypothetical protein